jgi:hypothetical protein
MTFGDLKKLRKQRDGDVQGTPDQTATAKAAEQADQGATSTLVGQLPISDAQTSRVVTSDSDTANPDDRPADHVTSRRPRQPVEPTTLDTRMLAARISHAYARELERNLLNATEYIPRVTKEQAIPALIRLLRDPETFERWLDEIEMVRAERQSISPR